MKNDPVSKVAKTIKEAIDNTTDAIHEATHRAQAEDERVKREVAGDDMNIGDKASSIAREATHRTQAEIDAAKRHVREDR